MTSESESAVHRLEGCTLDGGWTVGKRRELPIDHSGGAYSVGYSVSRGSQDGFLKALDYSRALASDDPARALQRITVTFNAERDLLAWCASRGLNRIVRALDSGTVRVPGAQPDAVQYLIFEVADDDSRAFVAAHDVADQIPMIWLAHEAAAALGSLHFERVIHQDVKPSNFLVWTGANRARGKLADVGCAYVEGRPVPHDDKLIAGDCAYASPELLYECPERTQRRNRRQAGDIYMLGNLITFLMTSVPYNGIFQGRLDPSQRWQEWGGTFDEVLPALIDAHGLTLRAIEGALLGDFAEEVTRVIDELCNPDPDHRGDPVARRHGLNPFSLERYVSRLDLIYKRALVKRRRAS